MLCLLHHISTPQRAVFRHGGHTHAMAIIVTRLQSHPVSVRDFTTDTSSQLQPMTSRVIGRSAPRRWQRHALATSSSDN